MSNNILTKDGRKLTIFENKVVVDKNLPKWRRAEAGIEKTSVDNNSNSVNSNVSNITLSEYFITNGENDPDAMSYSDQIRSRDIDRDVNAATKWLPLYEVAEGVSFDALASAGIKDLTRLIAEKKLKFVIGGYGSFGNTQSGTIILNSNPAMDTVVSNYNTQLQVAMEKSAKNNIFYKIKSLFKKKESEVKEDEKYIDALEFFSLVKLTSKDSVSTYRDRVSDYLKAIHNAVTVGQTALVEDLLRGLVTNKYESVLFSEGFYYVVNEDQMVKFVSQCEKGIKLDYVKNFTRPMPQDIVDKIAKVNQLEVFDNYVVLYYDPEGKIYKETAQEEAKRKDPIIFGVIAGSEKLYYIADWVDEYCDLSLEKFIDAIGLKKDQLHMDYDPSKEIKKEDTKKKAKIKKKIKKNKN